MDYCKIALALFLCLSITSCATIMHGKMQDIHVNSNPPGAVVRVNNITTKTPGVIALERGKAPYTLVFEKEGHAPVTVELKKGLDGWVFGNILIGGIIGIVIDFVSGSAYRINPSKVDVDFLEKSAFKLDGKDIVVVFVDLEYIKRKGINLEELEKI